MIREIWQHVECKANCIEHAKRIAKMIEAAGGERVKDVTPHERKVTHKQLTWVNDDEESEFCKY